jgi:tetratricopeptide (TPR) repeat protein
MANWRHLIPIACVSLLVPVAPAVASPDSGSPPASAPSGADAAPPDAAADEAAPQSEVRVVRLRDLLRQAVQHYQRSEFKQALTLLDQILGYVKTERSRVAQQTWTYLAFVKVAYGETDQAVAAFERALAIEPSMSLTAPPPKISTAFEQAQRRYQARVRALDHDPPDIDHVAVAGKKPHGAAVAVRAKVHDVSGVRQVRLNYRIAGSRGYATLRAEQESDGEFVATIPAPAVVRPGVEYYLEAWDTLGNGPALKGSAALPIEIEVEGGPTAAAKQERAWYQKWWVWAAISGVAVAAGGIGAAAYLTRDETARVNVRVPDGLSGGAQ